MGPYIISIIYIYTYIQPYVHVYTHTPVHTNSHIHIYKHIQCQIYQHTYIHTDTHVHTHIRKHVQGFMAGGGGAGDGPRLRRRGPRSSQGPPPPPPWRRHLRETSEGDAGRKTNRLAEATPKPQGARRGPWDCGFHCAFFALASRARQIRAVLFELALRHLNSEGVGTTGCPRLGGNRGPSATASCDGRWHCVGDFQRRTGHRASDHSHEAGLTGIPVDRIMFSISLRKCRPNCCVIREESH